VTGRWFSPGTLVSSTNKTEIVESGVKQHETNAYALVVYCETCLNRIFLGPGFVFGIARGSVYTG
jgi:hypothetical protein